MNTAIMHFGALGGHTQSRFCAPMAATGALLLLVASASATDAARHPLPAHLQRLRSVADLPAPATLDDAVALHAEAKRRAARIQQHYGHTAPAPLVIARQPLTAAAESAILRPTDFGADPTGATDSSPAFAKALATLRISYSLAAF